MNTAAQNDSSKDIYAYISIGAGVLSLCAWIIPLCGCPISIIGVILGVVGMPSTKRNLAIAGIVLCAIGFVLTIISAVIGVAVSSN